MVLKVNKYINKYNIGISIKKCFNSDFQVGDPLLCSQIADTLIKEKGHYVQAINYPTVAKGQEKLRLAPTPKHTHIMMDKFVEDTLNVFQRLNIPKVEEKTHEVSRAIRVH